MGNLRKELAKCKHPNSRKTKALAKKAKRMNNKHKSRLGHAIKSNVVGEKLSWFLEHIEDDKTPLKPVKFKEIIQTYLHRFDDELEQIKMKQAISKNRAHQHASRLNVINFTIEREKAEFNGGGMELLNLCDSEKLKSLQNWDGNAINVQHFKLDLISSRFLDRLERETSDLNVSENQNPVIIVTPPGEQKEDMICDLYIDCFSVLEPWKLV